MTQTCFNCRHADFGANADNEFRGLAKCKRSVTLAERATHYNGRHECDKKDNFGVGVLFMPAPPETILKREKKLNEWRMKP